MGTTNDLQSLWSYPRAVILLPILPKVNLLSSKTCSHSFQGLKQLRCCLAELVGKGSVSLRLGVRANLSCGGTLGKRALSRRETERSTVQAPPSPFQLKTMALALWGLSHDDCRSGRRLSLSRRACPGLSTSRRGDAVAQQQ